MQILNRKVFPMKEAKRRFDKLQQKKATGLEGSAAYADPGVLEGLVGRDPLGRVDG